MCLRGVRIKEIAQPKQCHGKQKIIARGIFVSQVTTKPSSHTTKQFVSQNKRKTKTNVNNVNNAIHQSHTHTLTENHNSSLTQKHPLTMTNCER